MSIEDQNRQIRDRIQELERRIEEMHREFQEYRVEENSKMPDWQGLERDFLSFSRRGIQDLTLAKDLERVMYKFQNRKKIWLSWVDGVHHGGG